MNNHSFRRRTRRPIQLRFAELLLFHISYIVTNKTLKDLLNSLFVRSDTFALWIHTVHTSFFFQMFSNNRTVKGDTKLLFPENKETKIYGRQNLVDKKLQLTLLFLEKKKKAEKKKAGFTRKLNPGSEL